MAPTRAEKARHSNCRTISCCGSLCSSQPKKQHKSPKKPSFISQAVLPFRLEEVILRAQRGIPNTVRAPGNICTGCTQAIQPKPEAQLTRLAAVSGKPKQMQQECGHLLCDCCYSKDQTWLIVSRCKNSFTSLGFCSL